MTKGAAYAILGRGRWARRMGAILAGEGREVRFVEETRQKEEEDSAAYRWRLAEELRARRAEVAWLCVPPGEHIAGMLNAALDAGLHVVVEQPWLMTEPETAGWIERARSLGRITGVHYEYCLLEALESWKREYGSGEGGRFGGVFHHSRSRHLQLPAMDVLGTHLLSIREYAVPEAEVGQVDCGYERADERRVWLEKSGHRVAEIDFLENEEPLIQRYIERFEAAMESGEFTFDLAFAARVSAEASALKDRMTV